MRITTHVLGAHATSRIHVALLMYGVAFALFAGISLTSSVPDHGSLMAMRENGVRGSLTMLRQGHAPLLLSRSQAPRELKESTYAYGPKVTSYRYFPAPQGDDPGIYLYLPLIGWTTGQSDPLALLKVFFIGLFLPLFIFYPLIFHKLLDSYAAALLAPWLLLSCARFLSDSDIYWVGSWCLLGCVPLLLLLYQRWRWGSRILFALAGVMVVASFATSIRTSAGLPIAFAGIILLFLRERIWRRRLIGALIVLVAYQSIAFFGFRGIEAARDASIDHAAMPTYHYAVWHSMYIGLGYIHNPYGLRYDDDVALSAAKRADPNVTYLGDGYGSLMRHIYFRFVRDHPRFFVDNIGLKTYVVLRDALRSAPFAFILLPLLTLIGRRRQLLSVALMFLAPALAWAFLQSVLVLPIPTIELGWLGAWGFLTLLALVWLAALAVDVARALIPTRGVDQRNQSFTLKRALVRPTSAPLIRIAAGWLAVFLVIAILVAGPISPIARALRRLDVQREYAVLASPLVPQRLVHGRALQSWDFSKQLPNGWTTIPGTRATASRGEESGLEITTTPLRFGYQLQGPTLRLAPGEYYVVVNGKVARGGLTVGILDAARNSWHVVHNYWEGQTRAGGKIAAPLQVERPLRLTLILANWAPKGGSSAWVLQRITILRVPRLGRAAVRPRRVVARPAQVEQRGERLELVGHLRGRNRHTDG
jgi:hypothetical protein